jgi:guanyl-specific ribonuclease Sa
VLFKGTFFGLDSRILLFVFISFGLYFSCDQNNSNPGIKPIVSSTTIGSYNKISSNKTSTLIPGKVTIALQYIISNGRSMPGYIGGRKFGNFEKRLPEMDNQNKPIQYQEWDVNPHRKGINRGVERIITSNNGKFYYTHDHYQNFEEIFLGPLK